MEIVNDSGVADSGIYVMMSGGNFQVVNGGIPFIDLVNNPTATVNSVALTSLSTNGLFVVSTLTGRTNPVYSVNMVMAQSARLFLSHSPSLQFLNGAAPTNVEGYRFDKCEFDFTSAPTWAANLTSVDFVGIPLRLEAVDSTTEQPFDSRSFYISRDTLVNRLANQISTSGGTISQAIQRDTSNNFLRILSPATITGNSATGSANPYPSFSKYLQSLVDNNYVINSTGTQAFGAIAPTYVNDQTNNIIVNIPTYQATYNYSGTVAKDAAGSGYVIKLTGSMSNWSTNNANNVPIPIPVPPVFTTVTSNTLFNAVHTTSNVVTVVNTKSGPQTVITPVTVTTYTPTTTYYTNVIGTNITLLLPSSAMDKNIYGCPLSTTSYTITNPSPSFPPGVSPTNTCNTAAAQASYFNGVFGNTVYSYAVANIQSGLNFGLLNGNYSNNTSNWFKNILPPAIPFGAGRPKNDGFYNPYTALLYNSSDSYGFAFNDRSLVGTNPLISYKSTNTNLRVTLLPDNQLDAPEVTADSPTQSSVRLSWPPVRNVPANYSVNYLIDSYPPMPGGPVSVTGNSQVVNLTGGLPYQFNVTAKAVAPGGTATNQSYSIPILASAAGGYSMPSGTFTNQFTPAGWTVGVFSNPANYPITIAGQPIAYSVGTNNIGTYGVGLVTGNAGTNYYPIVVKDSGANTIYQNSIKFVMGTNGLGGFFVTEAPELPGNSLPLDIAPPRPATNPLTFPQGPFTNVIGVNPFYPTVSVPGQPETFKQYAPAIFPPVQSYQEYWEQKSLEKYFFINPNKY